MGSLMNSVFGGGGSSGATQKLMADPQAFISGANLEASRDRYIKEMEAQKQRGPVGIDPNAAQAAQAATATKQGGLGDFLMQRARGEVPSVADKMLQQRQGQNLNQMAALAQNAGSQGGNATRNIFRAQGDAQAAIQNEAAVQKLQEQMQAANLANNVFGTQRGQDLQAGQMLQAANTFNAGAQDMFNQQSLGNIMNLRNIDEADRQAMMKKALADSEVKVNQEAAAVGSQTQALGAVMSLASMAAMSDEKQKTNVESGTEGAANFLRSVWKNKDMSTGEKIGKTGQSVAGNMFGALAQAYGGQNHYSDNPEAKDGKQLNLSSPQGGGFMSMLGPLKSQVNEAGMRMIDNVIGGMDGSRAPGQGGMSGAGNDMLPGSGGIGQERQFDASGSVGKGIRNSTGNDPMAAMTASKGVGGGSMPGGGTMGGMMKLFSDEKLKNTPIPGEGAAAQFLRAIEPKTYTYKNQAFGQGPQLGVMAQDLEKAGPVGQQMVIDTPQGKMVDYGKGFGALMATNAALQQQVDELNKKIGEPVNKDEPKKDESTRKPKGRGLMGGTGSIQKGSEMDQFLNENLGTDPQAALWPRPEDIFDLPNTRTAKRTPQGRG